jgi:hypothetical protein
LAAWVLQKIPDDWFGQTVKQQTPLVSDLNLPVGIVQSNDHTWYVTSLGDKSVLKVSFE